MSPSPSLRARLLLGAILPAAATAGRMDTRARQSAASLGGPLRFSTTSGAEACLLPDDRGAIWLGRLGTAEGLHLRGTDNAWAALLTGRAWPPVLPVAGWTRLPRLRHFAAWMERTRQLLETTEATGDAPAAAATQLAAAVFGAAVLLRHGAATPFPGPWTAAYRIGTDGPAFWVDAAGTSGTGTPPAPPWTEMSFDSPATALAAFHDRADTLALANTGRIRIRGHLPLADSLEVAMARAGAYLRGAHPGPR